MENEKFYSCEQVATRYGVQVRTVWEWIKEHRLPAVKIGGLYRIATNDLEAFERDNRTVPKKDD